MKNIHKQNENTRNTQITKHLIKKLSLFQRKKWDKGLEAQYKNIPKKLFP